MRARSRERAHDVRVRARAHAPAGTAQPRALRTIARSPVQPVGPGGGEGLQSAEPVAGRASGAGG